MRLRPFLSYYGGKWRAAPRYAPPAYSAIIEPFAGGAGYSLNYADRQVILCERDPRIALIWRFLIHAAPADVLALPLMALDQSVADLPTCDPGGLELIRAWLQGASRNAKNHFSTFAKKAFAENPRTPAFWGEACRARIAAQVPYIKHWLLHEGTYSDLPNAPATWFIDPPYNNRAGETYRHGPAGIDYAHLAAWCREREGQVIVCENEGAAWLPFRPLYETSHVYAKGRAPQRATEAVWP